MVFADVAIIFADVAQLAEQLICNQQVIGSSPIIGFIQFHIDFVLWADSRVAKGDRRIFFLAISFKVAIISHIPCYWEGIFGGKFAVSSIKNYVK